MRSCRRLTKTSSTCSYQNCGVAGLTKKSISQDRCERNCLARGRICQKHILADERRRKRTLKEPGVRRQESGVRSQESGVRSQESGVRSQESGVRSQESGVRSQESGVRGQES